MGLKAFWLYNRGPAHDISYGGGRAVSKSSVLWFVEMNTLVQNHNHCTTAGL